MNENYTSIETNIGCINGFIDENGKLIVENENPNLVRFLPSNALHTMGDFLKNPNNSLIVLSPEGFSGEWVFSGRDISRGDAFTPYPFIFTKK
ncbi:hypothetical protein [Morganella morganii]|uniref:hypothetical protein n=1 Tax=Morganella morganii TaxID=582 RepID=UPI001BDA2995|nr:hypothetical protein [Morganella morganii]EKU4003842.1 hypothetical protein [Morganella morganii]MBT0405067.1 hypothetical protein [Morganella morganii subsp. morganii]